jgi:hypothetical protein
MTVSYLADYFEILTAIIQSVVVFMVDLFPGLRVHYKSVHSDSYGLAVDYFSGSGVETTG